MKRKKLIKKEVRATTSLSTNTILSIILIFLISITLIHLSNLSKTSKINAMQDEQDSINSFKIEFETEDVPPNFKVAFIGDQGINNNSKAVLRLIKSEGADMVLHQGDFDYSNNPDAWNSQITDVLGADFPYFASIGNHDVDAWPGYQKKLQERLDKINSAKCYGDLGVNSACQYKGIYFVLSGIGTYGADHIYFLKQALNKSNAKWKICSWHKNQKEMQTGYKGNEVGWEAFEICKNNGAFIVMGHEHAYSRTYSLTDFANQTIYSSKNNEILTNNVSFAIVSGLGGQSLREPNPELINSSWWAKAYNENYGALFCTFNSKLGNSTTANCYFKTTSGKIIDEFKITNAS